MQDLGFSNRIGPNPLVFALASFFAPWQILGFTVQGNVFYLTFLFVLVDLNYWLHFPKRLDRRVSKIIILGLLFGFYFFLRTQSPLATFVKLGSISAYVVYFSDGLMNHGYGYLRKGALLSVSFAFLQFVEGNFFHTTYLSVSKLQFPILDGIFFGTGSEQGASYDSNVVQGLTRVSGTANEPGHYSVLCVAMLGIFQTERKMFLAILLGLLVSFSKVTPLLLLLFLLVMVARFVLKVPNWSVLLAIVGFYYVSSNALIDQWGGRASLLKDNVSIHERVLPAAVYRELDFTARILGTGYRRACGFLPESFLSVGEYKEGLTRRPSGDEICAIGAHSGIGAFLFEQGLLALGLIAVLLSKLERFGFRRTEKSQRSNVRKGLFCLAVIPICFASIHYFTFFPLVVLLCSAGLEKIRSASLDKSPQHGAQILKPAQKYC